MKILVLVGVLFAGYIYYLNHSVDMVFTSLNGLQQTYTRAEALASGVAVEQ